LSEGNPPRLDTLSEAEAFAFVTKMLTTLSPDEEYRIRDEDYVMELPQSGERIRGRENMREFQRAFPTPPKGNVRRVLVRQNLWIVEGALDYGQSKANVVCIFELRDGKIVRDTRYYG
jgi:hypothetical protein